jgi:Family of unknown function (DUF5677)
MAKENSLWVPVLAHADRLLQLVNESSPKGEFEIPTAYIHIAGMFWRARRLYDGVLLLLKGELPEEAAFLARSLFETSLRLQQLADEAANRNALILGWANRSIDEQRGLLEVGRACGHDTDIGSALASLEEQRQKLHDYGARHGVTGFQAFRSVKDGAFRFGRKDDYWTYEWAHESVHGTDAAWMFARRKSSENTAGLYAKTNDPTLLSGFALFAARSMANASEAAFTIFGWALPAELMETVKEIERTLDSAG